MSRVSLDDIRNEAAADFGFTEVPLADGAVCVLRNLIRLSDEERAAVTGAAQAADAATEEGEDEKEFSSDEQVARFNDMFLALSEDKETGAQLVKELNGHLDVQTTLFKQYMKDQDLGKAQKQQD